MDRGQWHAGSSRTKGKWIEGTREPLGAPEVRCCQRTGIAGLEVSRTAAPPSVEWSKHIRAKLPTEVKARERNCRTEACQRLASPGIQSCLPSGLLFSDLLIQPFLSQTDEAQRLLYRWIWSQSYSNSNSGDCTQELLQVSE